MYSLNQIRKKLNDIADAHLQIQSFGFGETFEVNEKNGPLQYPLMYVVPTGGSISGKTLSVRFTLLFMDRIHPDGSNKDDVSSDQLLIATDILAELSNPDYSDYFNISDSNSLDAFTERFADDVTGWSADITLDIPYTRDRCAIPQNPSSDPNFDILHNFDFCEEATRNRLTVAQVNCLIAAYGSACDPVSIIDQNETEIAEVEAGGTYQVIVFSGIDGGNASTVFTNSIIAG